MTYTLRNDLSFCRVDDRLIFLDIRNDRYFRLSSNLERPFIAYANGNKDTGVGSLVERNILVEAPGSQGRVTAVNIEYPARSALEQSCQAKLHLGSLVDVFITVCSIRRQLRTRPLRTILDSVVAFRPSKQPRPGSISDRAVEQLLLEASGEFRLARAYTPVETRCLLDSLAMVKFLARRRLHASIVFGVTSDPFSAHCWVQAGDLVLNDTVGHANAHTPIRVI
ncbi:lasso peptide biosynthesis B2 protein [Dyella sp. S184]|uniref:lasso peptide biosynthesis B2 protein n=1 Tax=Dyella sp. S184 TaxID=1641862 RepID=UPI00131AFDA6|nr:lasso peptide biosynthesis B2 protein [Dyella sp. S184]